MAWQPKSTSWAEDAEKEEEEEKERAAQPKLYTAPSKREEEAFPTLEAALTKQPKGKKSKAKSTTFSLSEFTTGKYVGPGGGKRTSATDTGKLTISESMALPKGPRERDPEDESGALGGGFKGYGGFRGGDNREENKDDRRPGGRSGGGFGRDSYGDRDEESGMPSRADEAGDWGATKKFVPTPSGGGGGRDRYDDDRRGTRDEDRMSRADDVDDWGAAKKFVPSSSGGGGMDRERRSGGGGFDDAPSRADGADNWGASKRFVASTERKVGSGSGYDAGPRGADSGDRWTRRYTAPVSDSRPSERPRLILQKRSTPLDAPAPVPASESAPSPTPAPTPASTPAPVSPLPSECALKPLTTYTLSLVVSSSLADL